MATKLQKEEKEVSEILEDIRVLEEKLIEKRPSHFTMRDVVNALFGAFVVGITFMFKGLLFYVGLRVDWQHIIAIILTTVALLTAQIYFIGYSRVADKKERPFLQFWAKRIIAIYGISLFVSMFLIYLYGIDALAGGPLNVLKLVIVISLPCAAGAAIPSLMRKY